MINNSIPEVINANQFYAFNKKTGKISIGTIVGKSALTIITFYEVNGKIYENYPINTFSDVKSVIILDGKEKLYGYVKREKLVKDYQEYIEKEEKKKNTQRKTTLSYYAVDKSSFECQCMKNNEAVNQFEIFDNKDEAIDYAKKGIEKNKKTLTEFLNKFNDLYTALEKIEKSITVGASLSPYKEYPSTLKINDSILMVKVGQFVKIIENEPLTVKEFITPTIAKLSDNTALVEKEFTNSTTYIIKYENKDIVQKIIRKRNALSLKQEVKCGIDFINKRLKIYQKYVPFVTKNYGSIHFSIDCLNRELKRHNNLKQEILNL